MLSTTISSRLIPFGLSVALCVTASLVPACGDDEAGGAGDTPTELSCDDMASFVEGAPCAPETLRCTISSSQCACDSWCGGTDWECNGGRLTLFHWDGMGPPCGGAGGTGGQGGGSAGGSGGAGTGGEGGMGTAGAATGGAATGGAATGGAG